MHSAGSEPWWKSFARYVYPGLILLAVYAVVWRILDFDVNQDGPPSATSTDGVLIQMVQWTVSSVLAFGGAIVGLNWYQSERRQQQDRDLLLATTTKLNNELESVRNSEKALRSQVDVLSNDISRISGVLEEIRATRSQGLGVRMNTTRNLEADPIVPEETIEQALLDIDQFVNTYQVQLPGGGQFLPYDAIYQFFSNYSSTLGFEEMQPVRDRLERSIQELETNNPAGAEIVQKRLGELNGNN